MPLYNDVKNMRKGQAVDSYMTAKDMAEKIIVNRDRKAIADRIAEEENNRQIDAIASQSFNEGLKMGSGLGGSIEPQAQDQNQSMNGMDPREIAVQALQALKEGRVTEEEINDKLPDEVKIIMAQMLEEEAKNAPENNTSDIPVEELAPGMAPGTQPLPQDDIPPVAMRGGGLGGQITDSARKLAMG
jgi:hypothetical protein